MLAIDGDQPVAGSFESLFVVDHHPRTRSDSLADVRVWHGIAKRHTIEALIVQYQNPIRRMAIILVKPHVAISIWKSPPPQLPYASLIRTHPVRRGRNRRADQDALVSSLVFDDESPRPEDAIRTLSLEHGQLHPRRCQGYA